MPIFGWDASHYDGPLTTAILASAKAEGIVFFTHKLAEGLSDTEGSMDDTALAAARSAGIEFLGGYLVPRSNATVTAQVDRWIALADAGEPWWRSHPGWFWQIDLERWIYDNVPASVGIACAQEIRRRTGRWTILYASHSQYWDGLSAWDGPIWNADYVSATANGFAAMYPGDNWTPLHSTWRGGWAPYSDKTPTILQYTSSATIAGLTTCDANAFRGSVDQFRALITGRDDDDMKTVLVRLAGGDGRVWLSNGVVRYHIDKHLPQEPSIADGPQVLRDVIAGVNPVLGSLVDTTVHDVQDLDAFGAEIPHDLAARMDALADAIAGVQGSGAPTQDQVDAAVAKALQDPAVLKGIGDAIAAHLHVN